MEDGSTFTCEKITSKYEEKLSIQYLKKQNSGPGDSRNYGIKNARADYFIILDSDVELAGDYLEVVTSFLNGKRIDCFGGIDTAKKTFTPLQKAVDYSMTSFWTTGGIRGGKKTKKFQPRSFNMGLSKKAFLASGGFGKIHPGEDPDLVLRLWKMGFKTTCLPKAKVFHKRRINWQLFYKQVYKFGQTRSILNKWHPEEKCLVFWLPSLFLWGLILAGVGLIFKRYELIFLYGIYSGFIFIDALFKHQNTRVGFLSIIAVFIQFIGYGWGFLKGYCKLKWYSKTDEKKLFPKLFFS